MTTTDTATVDAPQSDEEKLPEEDEALHCAECGHQITHTKHARKKGGQFQHTCVNPAGVLYQIGCFAEADGCREIGPESDDFSWFDGYTWQVTACADCQTHLGWRFWSPDDSFYGLILKKLA